MKATANRLWCRRGFDAITLFGRIYTRDAGLAQRFNSCYDRLKNHETIHLRQAQNTRNSWLLFYLLYLYYSFRASFYWRKMPRAAYLLNPFEMEAYLHDHDLHYLDGLTHGASAWRDYARLSLSERADLLRSHGLGRIGTK